MYKSQYFARMARVRAKERSLAVNYRRINGERYDPRPPLWWRYYQSLHRSPPYRHPGQRARAAG